jgi:tripartite-type tricarboxylate transporter receptor subunit TctC
MFQIATHTQMTHVPYKGSGAAVVDLIAGLVDVNFDTVPAVLPHIKSGKLRALAVTTRQRIAALPDVPTLIEAGLPDYQISAWYMLMGPPDMPAALVQKISSAFIQAVKDPATREKLQMIDTDALGSSPEQAKAFLATEIDRWSRIAKEKNIHED